MHLLAEQDDFTVIKFFYEQVDLTCLIDDFSLDCVVEGNYETLCLVLNKALCGASKVTLLRCNLLTDTLVEQDFKLNPHDLCEANAVVKGKQCTIMLHADDTKMSHSDSNVVDEVT